MASEGGRGCTPAQNSLGVVLGSGDGVKKNVKEAILWLRKALRGGDTIAANNLAITYRETGNLRLAVKWFRKAVDAGDDEAGIQLGIRYYWGQGVRKDTKAAVRCFRKATRAKDISGYGKDDAFFLLGLAYFEGKGVKRSLRTASKLFQPANVDNDNPAARKMLSQLSGPAKTN